MKVYITFLLHATWLSYVFIKTTAILLCFTSVFQELGQHQHIFQMRNLT